MTDLEQAYAWYESQSVGRGDDFLIRVDASFAAIIKLPDLHPRIRANYRRALIRKYPYAIFYEYVEPVITVYCVLHTSLDPGKWRRRLP